MVRRNFSACVFAVMVLFFVHAGGEKKKPALMGSQTPEEFFSGEFPLWKEQFMGEEVQKLPETYKKQVKENFWRSVVDATLGLCPWSYETFPKSVEEWKKSRWVLFYPVSGLKDYSFSPSGGKMTVISGEEREKILKEAPVGSIILYKTKIEEEKAGEEAQKSAKWYGGYAIVFEVKGKEKMEKRILLRDYVFSAGPPMDGIYCVANQIFSLGMLEVAEKGKAGEKVSEWGKGVVEANTVAWEDKEVSGIAREIFRRLGVELDIIKEKTSS